jgi:hypothetical protein
LKLLPLLISTSLLLASPHALAQPPKKLPPSVTLRVIDVIGIAPITVRVKVRVQRDERNRQLEIRMQGPYDGESMMRELDSASPITYDRNFEIRGGGPVTFSVYVTRKDGSKAFAEATYCYVGTGEFADCKDEM